jgi:hypothetical protein
LQSWDSALVEPTPHVLACGGQFGMTTNKIGSLSGELLPCRCHVEELVLLRTRHCLRAKSPPGSASAISPGAHLKWMFTTEKARTKMGRAYPRPAATLDQPAKESLCRGTRSLAPQDAVNIRGRTTPTVLLVRAVAYQDAIAHARTEARR